MPQALKYKAKSIIYVEGDISDKIYVLQSGKIKLISTDIETGNVNRELVKTGEFFGVKSALGKYPREDTVDVLIDSVVLMFNTSEFERFIYANPRITLQMLKVFSNQLRRIHKQVEYLLTEEEQEAPEIGLFSIGEFYYKSQRFKQALYAFRRYLTFYPAGKLQAKATEYMIEIEKSLSRKIPAPDSAPDLSSSSIQNNADNSSLYYDGVTLFSKENYEKAINSFKQYVSANPEGEYTVKALCDIGKSLYFLKKHDESIKHFTSLVQKYPDHADLSEFFLYLGMANNAKGDKPKAETFYKKVIKIAEGDSSVRQKAKSQLKILGVS